MWVPLHLHSQYSILDATASPEKIAKRAAIEKMPACALTDHGNMYGAVDFYKACLAEGVKPIIGCEVYVAPQSRFEKKKSSSKNAYHLVLLAKDDEGYHNLIKLVSLGFLEGFYYHPRIDKEILKQHSKGLICLSACLSSSVSVAILERPQEALDEIKWHQDVFGQDYYLELQRHTMSDENVQLFEETWQTLAYEDFVAKQKKVNDYLYEVSVRQGIECVATNDTHYLDPDDWKAHEILLNIQSGEPVEILEKETQVRIPNPKRRTYASRELYFKTQDQMAELFKDIPEAISNAIKVADKCNLTLDFKTRHYPQYIPPALERKKYTLDEQQQAAGQYLKELCRAGVEKRYTPAVLEKVAEKYPGQDPQKIVAARLERELEIILSKGMCDYLLIVWDFINWAKQQGIPVGPGRGSGAGSIILYLIGVTDIEPLRFDLFFERFINPERLSYPDIDVDICMAKRSAVIDYTVSKYGKENVAQIITFGTMKAKMAIKDVGRVLSVPLAKVNSIAKLVPEDPQMTLTKALEIDVDLNALYVNDEEAKRLIDLAKKLEGSVRNTGIHAAGVIISHSRLMDHIPVCLSKDAEMAATQYSMKPVESVGMLKIDFLGLKTLTGIQIAVDAIAKTSGLVIDWVNLPLEDKATFQLLQQGRTQGIFQMESGGMQELAKQLQPDRFEEIIAIGALYRPGPMEMIPSFINRKHKKEPIEYDHPLMQSILSETYGIMVYQEQVMQIATQLAKYSLGEGDVLRRAMGKKDAVQMAKEREKFCKGAVSNGISQECAEAVFDKMEKFAAYGFNKSHAAAYGYLTYVTAYLKAHYPKEWMAALMTCDSDDLEKVAKFIREAHAMGIVILPPDINESNREFCATGQGIRFAMNGIKGIGEGVVELIIAERQKKGPFKDFYDFFKRIDLKKVGKKTIESLVFAGCFDFTMWSRDALKMRIDEMYDYVICEQQEAAAGVLNFFSLLGDEGQARFSKPLEVPKPLAKSEILKKEKQLLGFFLTGHPMDGFKKVLERLSVVPLSQVAELGAQTLVRTTFIVEAAAVKIASKTQKKFAILTVGDGIESFEVPIWPELYERCAPLCEENTLLYAILQVDKKQEGMRLQCVWCDDLTKIDENMVQACDLAYDKAKQRMARLASLTTKETKTMHSTVLNIKCDLDVARLSHILKLKEVFAKHKGAQGIKIEFCRGKTPLSSLIIGERYGIQTSEAFVEALKHVPGISITQ